MDAIDLDSGWSVGELAFAEIEARFRDASPQCIVEFGSGLSTVRLAQAFPAARLLSIDHDPTFYEKTLALLSMHGPADSSRVAVDLRRVRWARYGLALHQAYSLGDFPDRIDAALIDGPPGTLWRGREACLYQIFDRLRVGGIVILDDFDRPMEAAAAVNWRAVYGEGIETEAVQIGHGLCVVTKLRDVRPRWLSPRLLRPALSSHYRFARSVRDALLHH
jgi:predicted O-methyltransferase YrrM